MAEKTRTSFTYHIKGDDLRRYLRVPFEVPEGTGRIDIWYSYAREAGLAPGVSNTVDLGVAGPDGAFIGSSGSNRDHIWICGWGSAAGFENVETAAGTWHIIAGAYNIPAGGLDVEYTIEFGPKERRLYLGDMHLHSTGSDGWLTVAELVERAKVAGLDFISASDHNNHVQNLAVPPDEGVTVIPGVEWTHYEGHANLLGVARPVRDPFSVNDRAGMLALLEEARGNGATIVLNHAFCPDNPWAWGFDVPFDAIEVWNGGTPPTTAAACIDWWQERLCAGERIPITCGSDYHFDEAFRQVGMPCLGLYADSRSAQDLLAAVRAGHGFVTMDARGPKIFAEAGDAILGDIARPCETLRLTVEGLAKGDALHIVTDVAREAVRIETRGTYRRELALTGCRFMRFEVYRELPGTGLGLLWTISNPIYTHG